MLLKLCYAKFDVFRLFCFKVIVEKFEFFSGAFAVHFAKIAHKVAKSKYFVDIGLFDKFFLQ